ncbi:MAG: NAD/NADP octopine/nopaline dehydrogenase family protein [Bacillota bacterium]
MRHPDILAPAREGTCFAVLGAGHGGQAMAAHLALQGFPTVLWNRSRAKIEDIQRRGGIAVEGEVNGFASPELVTADLAAALRRARVIMVVVPASAHRQLARQAAPLLQDGQVVVLNPGRTGGALEFHRTLREQGCRADVTVAEAQTFIYASRYQGPGSSRIFRIKRTVPVAALPASRTMMVLRLVRQAFPQFVPAESVLKTSFDNIGAIFHPGLTILNAGRIEATGGDFEYYRSGVTPSVARVMQAMDEERVQVAFGFGVVAMSALEWMEAAYGVRAGNLLEAMQLNSAYEGIMAPASLETRYLFEDVPASLVPIASLGDLVGVPTPVTRSIIHLACTIHDVNYWATGRTVEALGLAGHAVEDVIRLAYEGESADCRLAIGQSQRSVTRGERVEAAIN